MSDQILAQLPWFNAFVESGRAPVWTMGVSDIHGFLTAMAIAGPIPDAEWMSYVWSGESPRFDSEEEAFNVMAELFALESQVKAGIGGFRPLSMTVLPHAGHGWYYAADWAEGFLQAIEANPQPWQLAIDAAEESLSVVLGTCYANHDEDNAGYVSLQALDEINYHIRCIYRLLQSIDRHRVVAQAA